MNVKTRDLMRIYRLGNVEVQAIRGLNLDVAAGEMVSVIGPSGSGKTTLLNIIGGLDNATAGSVEVGDTNVTALETSDLIAYRRKTVGHIFQTLNLIPTLTTIENIELPMVALKVPRNVRHKRAEELLQTVGLIERSDHKPDQLSGGEQQRVAIAAALANDAPLLLADEPTGELDTVNARIVVDYLSMVNQELGKTIIMVTHDSTVARAASRILKIEDGTIKASLTPAQIMKDEAAVSYVDQLRARLDEVNQALAELDGDFRSAKIEGDEYVARRQSLKQTKSGLEEELQRMGIVT